MNKHALILSALFAAFAQAAKIKMLTTLDMIDWHRIEQESIDKGCYAEFKAVKVTIRRGKVWIEVPTKEVAKHQECLDAK